MEHESSGEQENKSNSSTPDSTTLTPRTRGVTTLSWLISKPSGSPKEPMVWDEFGNPIGEYQVRLSDRISVLMRSLREFKWTTSWPEEKGPPSLGDLFIKTHTSKITNEPLDDASRRYINQMREEAGTDENGDQHPITDAIYRNVMPE